MSRKEPGQPVKIAVTTQPATAPMTMNPDPVQGAITGSPQRVPVPKPAKTPIARRRVSARRKARESAEPAMPP
jgi:hypothetical protein